MYDWAGYLQASHFQILSVHDDVHKAEQHREPESNHGIIRLEHILLSRYWCLESTLWAFEHLRNQVS